MPTARAAAAEPSFVMPSPYVIAIDPGHGGSATNDPTQLWDPGVVVGSVMEKDITLDLAFRLRALLVKERVKVFLTRTGDEYVEISERWNRVHASGARLFVSLHVNAFNGDPAINGATIFYPKRSEEHTSELQSRLHLVCRLLLEKKKKTTHGSRTTITTDR